MLGLNKVTRPKTVQVSNIGHISVDSLSAYFETRRSGASGDEVDVVIHEDQGCAIVTFKTCESKSYIVLHFINIFPFSEVWYLIISRISKDKVLICDGFILFNKVRVCRMKYYSIDYLFRCNNVK